MKTIELIFISLSLAMDAFSVSICKGLTMKYKFKRNSLIISLSFSLFQMIMPIFGYFLGNSFNNYFSKFNYLIAFGLLTIIGINMIKESYENKDINIGLSIKELIYLSIATSIDAFSVGITFSLFKVNILIGISLIGIITLILCLIGIYLGKYIGNKLDKKAQIFGGIVLIIIGIKILLENIL